MLVHSFLIGPPLDLKLGKLGGFQLFLEDKLEQITTFVVRNELLAIFFSILAFQIPGLRFSKTNLFLISNFVLDNIDIYLIIMSMQM